MSVSRYQRGSQRLSHIDAEAGEQVIRSLAHIAPDLATYILEFAFGDVFCRPGLSLKQRELATIAALTAMGTAEPQLKVHIAAGLNVGLSQQEIVETMIQMAVYAGFPAALNGVFAAQQVFESAPMAAKPVGITALLRINDLAQIEYTLSALQDLARQTQLEPGCLEFRIQHDVSQPDTILLWEQWRDETAFNEHLAAPHTVDYQAQNLTSLVQYWRMNELKL
ncbi:carboxymuconolactone decarboxylase family protein [Chitinibacter fontanus]|uniref:Carboxymuconolactone decarboxylase family protein n=1 Tax=Chitinibacter fontanus TaxID=1737446 RepID=A0A7D5ZF30_9NEIS|nr:carboxymuconolactone decarboxylase family protein [Chitinibacter fontanus]QLI82765.1 carboxymuconolactone decarboxylase family protein [Chitinibacter fontanus]